LFAVSQIPMRITNLPGKLTTRLSPSDALDQALVVRPIRHSLVRRPSIKRTTQSDILQADNPQFDSPQPNPLHISEIPQSDIPETDVHSPTLPSQSQTPSNSHTQSAQQSEENKRLHVCISTSLRRPLRQYVFPGQTVRPGCESFRLNST
jgi:hypothetical protein